MGNTLPKHLQSEKPKCTFEEWRSETVKLFAKAWKIDMISASRRIKDESMKEWYEDGFTPYVFFRENYQPIL